MYAARLAAVLKRRADIAIFGMGGPQMRAAGVDVVVDYSEVAVLGITEVLSHLPSLIRAMRKLVGEAQRRKPALAVLTDFPGFHLRLARKLKAHGIRNAYFICPQFWAWRPWRVRVVRRSMETPGSRCNSSGIRWSGRFRRRRIERAFVPNMDSMLRNLS